MDDMTTGLAVPIIAARQSSTEWAIRTQIGGQPDWTFAEWKMEDVGAPTNSWGLQRIQVKVIDPSGSPVVTRTLSSDVGSVYEFAMELVPSSVSSAPTPFTKYYGQAHGNVARTSLSIKVDGVESAGLAVGKFVNGQTCVFEQTFDIFNPGTSTYAGSVRVRHTFSMNGVLVEHWHSHSPGYVLYNAHAAMLPLTFGGADDMKTVQIGAETPFTFISNGVTTTYDVPVGPIVASTNVHDWKIELSLPDGTSGSPGGWDYAAPAAVLVRDNSASPHKVYVKYVKEAWADRIPAKPHAHAFRLRVFQGS